MACRYLLNTYFKVLYSQKLAQSSLTGFWVTLLLDYSTREMQENQRSPLCCSFRLTNLSQHGVFLLYSRGYEGLLSGSLDYFMGALGTRCTARSRAMLRQAGRRVPVQRSPWLKDVNGALLFLEEVTRLILPVAYACLKD